MNKKILYVTQYFCFLEIVFSFFPFHAYLNIEYTFICGTDNFPEVNYSRYFWDQGYGKLPGLNFHKHCNKNRGFLNTVILELYYGTNTEKREGLPENKLNKY